MFIVWDKFENAPYAKDNYGHFKLYGNKKAAKSYIYRNYLTDRCEVRRAAYHVYYGAV